jgi:hypothetical protein
MVVGYASVSRVLASRVLDVKNAMNSAVKSKEIRKVTGHMRIDQRGAANQRDYDIAEGNEKKATFKNTTKKKIAEGIEKNPLNFLWCF